MSECNHEIDCRTAVQQLWDYLDHELTAERISAHDLHRLEEGLEADPARAPREAAAVDHEARRAGADRQRALRRRLHVEVERRVHPEPLLVELLPELRVELLLDSKLIVEQLHAMHGRTERQLLQQRTPIFERQRGRRAAAAPGPR